MKGETSGTNGSRMALEGHHQEAAKEAEEALLVAKISLLRYINDYDRYHQPQEDEEGQVMADVGSTKDKVIISDDDAKDTSTTNVILHDPETNQSLSHGGSDSREDPTKKGDKERNPIEAILNDPQINQWLSKRGCNSREDLMKEGDKERNRIQAILNDPQINQWLSQGGHSSKEDPMKKGDKEKNLIEAILNDPQINQWLSQGGRDSGEDPTKKGSKERNLIQAILNDPQINQWLSSTKKGGKKINLKTGNCNDALEIGIGAIATNHNDELEIGIGATATTPNGANADPTYEAASSYAPGMEPPSLFRDTLSRRRQQQSVVGAHAYGGSATSNDRGTDDDDNLEEGLTIAADDNARNLVSATPVTDNLEFAEEVQQHHQASVTTTATKKKKKRALAFLGIALILIAAVVTTATVLLGNKKTETLNDGLGDVVNGTAVDNNNTTNITSIEIAIDNLPEHTLQAVRNDTQSPQALANEWVLKDPFLDTYDRSRKVQRFALATLYYATNGDAWTFSSNKNWLSYEKNECEWSNAAFLFDEEPCDENGNFQAIATAGNTGWEGTLPREIGLITTLQAFTVHDNPMLVGSIPKEIWELPLLRALALDGNKLTGTIPNKLPANLEYLDLAWNKLEGTIPTQVGLLSNLWYFSVGGLCKRTYYHGNCNLGGTIPSEIGGLTNLQHLGLHGLHNLTGSFPDDFFQDLGSLKVLDMYFVGLFGSLPSNMLYQLTSLEYLDVDWSFFTGLLPSLPENDVRLKEIYFHENEFTGSIPSGYWNHSSLEFFSVHGNRGLTGTIPDNFGAALPLLQELWIGNTGLNGTVPSSIGLCTDLNFLHLSDNQFSGALPTQIWGLSNLETLYIGGNLTGSIPKSVDFPKLEYLEIMTGSAISGIIPDSLCTTEFLDFPCSDSLCGCDCTCLGSV